MWRILPTYRSVAAQMVSCPHGLGTWRTSVRPLMRCMWLGSRCDHDTEAIIGRPGSCVGAISSRGGRATREHAARCVLICTESYEFGDGIGDPFIKLNDGSLRILCRVVYRMGMPAT